jgi:preprotein translocase subunit SecB
MNLAAFSFEKYRFEKIEIDFSKKRSNDLQIDFEPSGKFFSSAGIYELTFLFRAHNGDIENSFVKIECIATFKFNENISFEDIPNYFYPNSIAIIFPYMRAFISTVTLQANIPPIMLPTMNLSSLESPLRNSTKQI